MSILDLRDTSRFIAKLIDNGYDISTDFLELLSQLDFINIIPNIYDIITTNNTHTNISVTREQILVICDELCIKTIIKDMITDYDIKLDRMMDKFIVNINDRGMNGVSAYSNGYKIMSDIRRIYDINYTNVAQMINGIRNGLCVKNFVVDVPSYGGNEHIIKMFMTDANFPDVETVTCPNSCMFDAIRNFSNITHIKIDDTRREQYTLYDIISLIPTKLKTLSVTNIKHRDKHTNNINVSQFCALESLRASNCYIDDDIFKLCNNLKMLRINYNDWYFSQEDLLCISYIPDTITQLDIFTASNIKDDMLAPNTKLRKLIINNSSGITTCNPFAKSLIYVKLIRSNIRDDGLALCKNIRVLIAQSNLYITTCEPFAGSLRELDARDSGLSDDGIKLCTKLKKLCADNNRKITTCKPFAKSLIKLSARFECGIRNDEIKLCINLISLRSNGNQKITRGDFGNI